MPRGIKRAGGRRPRFAHPFITELHGAFKQPAITNGGEKPFPETRRDIKTRMIENLKKAVLNGQGAIRQNYSNGEFTASSLIYGLTLEDVSDRKFDLECAADVAYYDETLKLWHRQGGSFD